MRPPFFSIVLPTYNRAHFLVNSIGSVLSQNFRDWELLIIDDGSTDNTKEVAQNWVAKDSRFVYLHKENGGVSSARNFGIEKAETLGEGKLWYSKRL